MSYYGTLVTTGVHTALGEIPLGRESTGPVDTEAEALRLGAELFEGKSDVDQLRLQITQNGVGLGTYKMVAGKLIRV